MTRTRVVTVAVLAGAAIIVAAWATFGGLILHAHKEYDRAGAAAASQYGDLHGVRDVEVARGKTWDRCAVVELSRGSESLPTVTMVEADGRWKLADTSTEAAYFDTDDVNDEASCLDPLVH
jgi:hypothetical protein